MSVSTADAILDSARALWDARESITLDEVDGEFYWRHCRGELVQKLQSLLHDTEESFERTATVFDHLHRMEQEISGLGSWLSENSSPRLRDPVVSWAATHPVRIPIFRFSSGEAGSGAWLCLGVRNSRWRGADVEHFCRREADTQVTWSKQFEPSTNEKSFLAAVNFHLYGAGELSFRSDWVVVPTGEDREVRVESPLVMCSVAYPFPPEGTIAALYDAIVIGQRQWHHQLYGFQTEGIQTVDVAIRTWAIGLLVGLGVPYSEAENRYKDVLGLVGRLADPAFSVDRKNLLKRVPEARPYVYSPGRKPKTEGTRRSY